jgi:hypothetical protein
MYTTVRLPDTSHVVARRRLDRTLFEDLTERRGASTVTEKAAIIGVHRATVFGWFTEFKGSLAVAESVARTLGTDIDKLFPVILDRAA